VVAATAACKRRPENPPPPPAGTASRTFDLGFTDFPHDLTVAGLQAAGSFIAAEADLSVQHFDDGVPWPEALAGTAYPAGYLSELNGHLSLIPGAHRVYLAVTPLSGARDGLALYRGDTGNLPLPPPWDGYAFDHPDVAAAFLNHCVRMIDLFQPDYFAFAIEANLLLEQRAERWDALVSLLSATYAGVKAARPTLPIFVTIQAEAFHRNAALQGPAIGELLPVTDYVAVSAYPYFEQPDPAGLAATYFSSIAALAPAKPFAIAETGWPAEPITSPAPVFVPADAAAQRVYVERLLAEADARSARFVTWFFTRDLDDAWDSVLRTNPIAPVIRMFKDLGLVDGDGAARPALAVWRDALRRPRAASPQ
jgi:hypothetical protein